MLNGLALRCEVLVGLGEEAASAAGGVEHGFAELGVSDGDHEADDGPRRVELAVLAGGVAHFAEHGLVEVAERVDFVGRREVDLVDLVDHVAQQVAVEHGG